ncbi:MAG: hypothetical protein AAGG48_07215 [Planctomycetota bacterium]
MRSEQIAVKRFDKLSRLAECVPVVEPDFSRQSLDVPMNAKIVTAQALVVSFLWMLSSASAQDRPSSEAAEAPAFETVNIVLYNSTTEFGDRSPSVDVMAAFIKKVQARAAKLWSDTEREKGQSGLIAVAIRPNGSMKLWVDIEQEHQPKLSEQLEEKMRDIGVPPVNDGPVAFALNFHLWGGPADPVDGVESVKLPQAWVRAASEVEEELKVPDEILPLVWKRLPPGSVVQTKEMFVPDGFILEELKPIGGSILRPEDWTFKQQHRKNTFMWTISKEDLEDGSYETGMRIQFVAGIKKLTGQTAQEFIAGFMKDKAKSSKVIRKCPEEKQGVFTRVCLLTEKTSDGEKPSFRILYSCFWSNDLDMACLSIAGTTPEQWKTYESTFDTMAKFKLLDMDKIEAQRKR